MLEAFEDGEEETLIGQVFGDPAYTSTYLGSAVARGSTAAVPASRRARGTQAGYVDAVFDKGQCELLLPRGARVDEAYRKGGVYRIEGRHVP